MKPFAVALLLCFAARADAPTHANASARADAPEVAGDALLQDLNQTITWYRRLAAHSSLASEPSDVLYLDDNLQIARQVVALEFEFARADATLMSAQQEPPKQGEQAKPGDQPAKPGSSLVKAAADAAANEQKQEAVVAALEKEIDAARTPKAKRIAQEQLAAEKSDLGLMRRGRKP